MTPPTTNSMLAVLQDAYGTADTWHTGQTAVPKIKDKEVLVKIVAAGLDRGTWHLMTGLPYLGRLAFGIRKPKNPVPGRDLAGTIVAIGSSVTRFAVGDTVFGIGSGSFAEYAAAREDKLARTPTNLRVCSTAKVDLVRSLGADQVIDYTKTDFADGTEHYRLIIDIGGSSPLSRLRRALTHQGTLVIVGGEGGRELTGMGRQLRAVALSPFVSQRLTMLVPKEHYGDLDKLTEPIEAGTVTPSVGCTYPLDQAADAMHQLAAGQVHGKIAITT